jgi:hypothetical protein
VIRSGEHVSFLERRRQAGPDQQPDPMDAMSSLFDVAVLIAVGFLVVALLGFGLEELLSSEDVTIVKNPGTPEARTAVEGRTSLSRCTGV